nr:integrase, catalytic region, zinc finger, CCHC-type, peptidase aspartic, catalytic [Tanacetum cinerariifolium]
MKEKADEFIFVGYSNLSRAYRVFNKRTRVIMKSIHVNFDELPQMASDQISSDLAPECQTMALNHDSLSPEIQRQANVPQVDRIVTTSKELDLLFSPMFDELLNRSSKVVSKSSAVSAADASNQRQQHTTSLNIHITPAPTCQVSSLVPTVSSSKNINQAETHAKNDQVVDDKFINIFSTPVQDQGETSSRHVDSSNMHTFYQRYLSEHRWTKDHPLEQVIRNPSQSFSLTILFFIIENASLSCSTYNRKFIDPKKKKEIESWLGDSRIVDSLDRSNNIEYFDTFPTIEELEHHEWLLKYLKPSWQHYNRIMNKGLESRQKPSNPSKNINFVGRIKGLKVLIGNFTYACNFMILEDATSIIDHHLGEVVFGKPFTRNTGVVYDHEEGTVTFEKDDDKITFKMPHKMEASNRIDFKDINTNSIPSFVLGSNDDRRKTYYSDSLTLGPEYKEDESISKEI